jgi:hypothetical protein
MLPTAAIRTETVVDAAPEDVWALLADLGSYPEWNPFIVSATGRLAEGERLAVRIRDARGGESSFRPRVTALEPGRRLVWLGRLGLPGLFDGEHRFELEPVDEGRTRLVHAERFRGLLVPVLRGRLERDVRPQFAALNTALAARAEAGVTVAGA